jgi:hypothetical protein
MSAAEVKFTVWAYLKHYTYALFATSWNKSTKAVDAFLGIAVGAAFDPQNIQAPNWSMAAYIFGVVYFRSVAEYLAANPIPTSLASRHPYQPSVL